MTLYNNSEQPFAPDIPCRQTFLGIPYELGPVVGSLGAYAIVGWIQWNGSQYHYDGITPEVPRRVMVLGNELIVPPGLRYTREHPN